MDLSSFILIPLAALISACWIVGAAVLSKQTPSFRAQFVLSYGLGVIFMEPWRMTSWQDLGMFVVMLVMLAFWVAAGCLIGGLPATFAVFIGTKLRHRFGS